MSFLYCLFTFTRRDERAEWVLGGLKCETLCWCCSDVSGVELLMNNHQSLKAEIDARAENFSICVNLGKDLLHRRHPRSDEVKSHITAVCCYLLFCPSNSIWSHLSYDLLKSSRGNIARTALSISLVVALSSFLHRVSEKSSTSYFAEYFRTGLTDCKNFDGYRVRDNKQTQGCNQCFNF